MDDPNKIKEKVGAFCSRFVEEIRDAVETFQAFGIDIRPSLPEVLIKNNISFECVFSEDRNHVLMLFKSSERSDFQFAVINGDVFNYFDKSGLWEKMPVGVRIENSSFVRIDYCAFRGCKPFEIIGDKMELYINNLLIDIPSKGPTNLEYVIVMSYPIFLDRLESLARFVKDLILGYFKYFEINGIRYAPQSTLAARYKQQLMAIKCQMEKLFFDDQMPEHDIDRFIESNPIIMDSCLDLILLLHQVELQDLLQKYGQDLKPDLLGFHKNDKQWIIVDYKRAKRTIIKNPEQVRTSFRAEVHDLEAQLRDYREYFQEQVHRQYFKGRYGYDIEFPVTIGVIGQVSQSDVRDFNRLLEDLPRWIDIVPYNYIYERFCRFIDAVIRIS